MKEITLSIVEYHSIIAPSVDFSNMTRLNNMLVDMEYGASSEDFDIYKDFSYGANNLPNLSNIESFKQDFSLSHIPPLERRRLNNAAKCAFSLLPLFSFESAPLLIFSSYKGEINRCFEMLFMLKNDDLVMPSAFSLSVLNATPALIAIAESNRNEISAISGNPSLEYALIDAYIKLIESKNDMPKEALILSYYEELDLDAKKPSVFYLLALKVTLESNKGIHLNTQYQSHIATKSAESMPQILSDLYFLSALEECKKARKSEYGFNDSNMEWRHCLKNRAFLGNSVRGKSAEVGI